jgi:hypothetical protein
MLTLPCHYLGDIADERFMKKANTSDITQFTLLFPSTSTSCMCSAVSLTFTHGSLCNPLVWIIFWFTLSAGSLVGFSFLGQIVWKVGSSFFCLRVTHLTVVAQFRANVRASWYVPRPSVHSVPLHWCTHTCIPLQLVSSRLENTPGFHRVTHLFLYSSSPPQSYHHHPLNHHVFLAMGYRKSGQLLFGSSR